MIFILRKNRLKLTLHFVIALAIIFTLFIPLIVGNPPKVSANHTTVGQTKWDGGETNQLYLVEWGGAESWNKYKSGTNIIATILNGNESVIKATSNNAEVVSSIYDLGESNRVYTMGFVAGFVDYNNFAAFTRGANSPTQVISASWQQFPTQCLITYRYVQFKVEFSEANSYLSSFTLAPDYFGLFGKIVDAKTGKQIKDATVRIKENAVITSNTYRFIANNEYGYTISWSYHKNDLSEYTITASKKGYKSQTKKTKFVSLNCDNNFPNKRPPAGETINLNFSLNPLITESTTNQTQIPTTTTTSITKVKLPSEFTKKGSFTTDLSKIKNPLQVKNLVLEVVGEAKIEFKEVVDLSTNKTIAAFENLSSYLQIDKGVVDLNSKTLSALNKKATITMYKLNHLFTPEVLVDGKKDTKGIVSNISYDKKKGILKFDVKHFSRFEAAAKIEILEPPSSQITNPNTVIKGRISDPNVTITGTFNGVKLAEIIPDKKTGEFTIDKLTFQDGENILKLSAEGGSSMVAPAGFKFIFGEAEDKQLEAANTLFKDLLSRSKLLVIAISLITILILVGLGYLGYKNKEKIRKLTAKLPFLSKPQIKSEYNS